MGASTGSFPTFHSRISKAPWPPDSQRSFPHVLEPFGAEGLNRESCVFLAFSYLSYLLTLVEKPKATSLFLRSDRRKEKWLKADVLRS